MSVLQDLIRGAPAAAERAVYGGAMPIALRRFSGEKNGAFYRQRQFFLRRHSSN